MKSTQCCVLCSVAVFLTNCIPMASAELLTIDSSQSQLTIGLSLGLEDPGIPGSYVPLLTATGQGGALPTGTFTGSVVPGFSNGLTAQASGSIDVQVVGGVITIGGATTIGLLPSGLWQPGTVANGSGTPLPGEIGYYLQGSLLLPNDTVGIVLQNATDFGLTATGSLDGLGNFSDPASLLSVVANLNGWFVNATLGINSVVDGTGANGTSIQPLAGNYSGGVLTFPISAFAMSDLSSTIPGLLARFTVDGMIVTTPVPEPSTLALATTAILSCVMLRKRLR